MFDLLNNVFELGYVSMYIYYAIRYTGIKKKVEEDW